LIRLENSPQLALQYQINQLVRELLCFYNPLAFPNYCFQLIDEKQFDTIAKQLESEQLADKKKILCKVCHHSITSLDQKIQVNGTHHHIFRNPAGLVFEIGCFSSAHGCVNYGTPTLEYTWFNGFTWRYALCSHCHLHLGWFYQSPTSCFYGLILSNLLEPGN
jgi:filamentous hemagglutinin family protein